MSTPTVLTDPEDAPEVRLLMARGQVFAAALEVADEGLRDWLGCLDGIARRVASGRGLEVLVERVKEEQAGT
ncbi:hypothetical protein GCM10010400_76540 [Streptomyces aculeolatus]|uniref:hypothetical protein n=1 Tax=Streptomyces aculeolatus TaxID=270689 RepID=UPI001CEDDEF1|nr:hypothetical protein [Streptomyces aculeolatus]